jgi:hypothetical protein
MHFTAGFLVHSESNDHNCQALAAARDVVLTSLFLRLPEFNGIAGRRVPSFPKCKRDIRAKETAGEYLF